MMKTEDNSLSTRLEFAQRLVDKLERLSADSYWAHQASGLRGSLLRKLDSFEENEHTHEDEIQQLEALINSAYRLLVKAAQEY